MIDQLFSDAEGSTLEQVFTRVNDSHPVDIFVGKDHTSLAIQVRSLDKPPAPPRIASLAIEIYPPKAGKWWTVIRLLRPELRFLFARLADDLVKATQAGEANAGRIVLTRLAQWQRLLAAGPTGLLSDSARRGLAAELSFLRTELVPSLGTRIAAYAWKGPFDAPRDFELSMCDVEVKAIRDGARALAISSLEQLDASLRPLYLWVQTVDVGPPLDGGETPTSLAALVGDIRKLLTEDTEAAQRFEDALLSAGYLDHVEYTREPLTLGRNWCLAVKDDFPRLERASTPPGVLGCTYDISWPDVVRYQCDTWRRDSK